MIKAGIVGLGWWGRVMVDALDGSSKIKIAKGTTRTRAKAEDYAAEKGFELVERYEDLIKDPEIDALIFATPHSQHEAQVTATAAAGKPVFVEKPFALDKAAAERAIDAVVKAGVVLGLGHNRRFHPSMTRLREKINSGGLGEIVHVESMQTAAAGLAIQTGHWRSNESEAPAGAMTGVGIHQLDAMIDLIGTIEEVYCRSVRRAVQLDTTDTTSVSLRFHNGATANLMCSLVTAPTYQFSVYGTKGLATVSKPSLEQFSWTPSGDGEPEDIATPGFNTVTAELENFADAVTGGGSYMIPHDQMIHGIAALEAAVKSSRSGQPVSVG